MVSLFFEQMPTTIERRKDALLHALIIAVVFQRLPVIRYLLKQPDIEPQCPHCHACNGESTELIGPRVATSSEVVRYYSPLNEALMRGNEAIVGMLLAHHLVKLDEFSLGAAIKGDNDVLIELCRRDGPPANQDVEPKHVAFLSCVRPT